MCLHSGTVSDLTWYGSDAAGLASSVDLAFVSGFTQTTAACLQQPVTKNDWIVEPFCHQRNRQL